MTKRRTANPAPKPKESVRFLADKKRWETMVEEQTELLRSHYKLPRKTGKKR